MHLIAKKLDFPLYVLFKLRHSVFLSKSLEYLEQEVSEGCFFLQFNKHGV